MAWEWAGPASGAFVGLAGLVAGWRVSVGSRKHDERMAQQRHKQDVKTADVQWYRDRRTDAYLQLLEQTQELGLFIASALEQCEADPSQPHVHVYSPNLEMGVWPRLAAFGSPEVVQEAGKWHAISTTALDVVAAVQHGDLNARKRIRDLTEAESTARGRLANTIRKDLEPGG